MSGSSSRKNRGADKILRPLSDDVMVWHPAQLLTVQARVIRWPTPGLRIDDFDLDAASGGDMEHLAFPNPRAMLDVFVVTKCDDLARLQP